MPHQRSKSAAHIGVLLRAAGPILVAAFTFSHTPSVKAQFGGGCLILGKVTNGADQPVRVMVELYAQGDELVTTQWSDFEGHFSFTDIPSGGYTVEVRADGYRTLRTEVTVNIKTKPKEQLTLTLEPAPAERQPPQTIPKSQSQLKLNAKTGEHHFDPKALREFEKGNHKQERGDLKAAEAHYQKALEIDPKLYPALNNLGALYLQEKLPAQAQAALLQSIKINPDDGQSYVNLGHLFYEQGRYPEAAERLEAGLKRLPDSAVGFFLLGSTYFRMGDLSKAATNLRAACTIDSEGLPAAHLALANVYLKTNNPGGAEQELEAYLKARPSDPQAPAIKQVLNRLRTRAAKKRSPE